ncbi:MAG: acetyl-CoA carboxylase carboxyl transferase subunit alpha, partial [Thiotrichales bacterium]|nr:acetyl-CoA carboxylase carboxyl transferase subunit alpha [Thiotrichales bacterium]
VTMMMEYSTYSVISPEGCASILWKDAANAADAATALGITSKRLKELGLIDAIIPEPLGGAHRNPQQAALTLKQALIDQLDLMENRAIDQLVDSRYQRYMKYGNFELA